MAEPVVTPESTVVPTKATEAWSKMDLAGQQAFVKKNPTFDPAKYNMQYATAPVTPVNPTKTSMTDPMALQPGYKGTNKLGNGTTTKVEPVNDKVEPVTEPVVTPVKTESSYTDDSEKRLLEIQNNLTTQYAQDNTQFQDRGTFDTTYHYGERTAAQKGILDKFYNQKSYERGIGALPSDDIAKGLVNGTYTDADLDYMKVNDVARYNEVMTKRAEQQNIEDNKNTLATYATQAGFDGGTTSSTSALPTIPTTDPELSKVSEQANTVSLAIDDIDKQIEQIQKDAEAHYGSLSKGQLSAIVRDQTADLSIDRNTKVRELTALNGQIKAKQDAYTMQQQQFTDQLALFNANRGMQKDMATLQMQQAELMQPNVSQNPLGTGAIITQWNPTTGVRDITTQGIGDTTSTSTSVSKGDLSGLASQYPNEASFKNNNPTGIKLSAASPALQQLWKDAGIVVTNGTNAQDGGSFAKFATIEDGMKAYDIVMTQRRGNATVSTYLKSRGTGDVGLSSDIMGKKINQLTADEKSLVQSAQIKKESPGLWQELFGGGNTTPSDGNTSLYSQFDTLKNPTVAQLAQLGANNGIPLAEVQKQRQTYQSTAGDIESQQFMNDYANSIKESYSGTQWIDLSGMTPTDKTKISKLANKAGILPILDKTQASKLNNISTVMEDLANVQSAIQSYLPNTARDLYTKVQNLKSQKLPGADARSSAIASYGTWRNSAIAALQALVGGQGAGFRITQTEINMSIDNDIPKVTDTKNVATAKFTVLEALLASAENGVTGNKKVTRKDVITQVMKSNPGMTYPDEYYTLTGINKPTTTQNTTNSQINAGSTMGGVSGR